MSATEIVGNYEISKHAEFDEDAKLFFVKMGIKTKKGMTLHYTVWGITEMSCKNKADALAEILSGDRFNILKYSKIIQQ